MKPDKCEEIRIYTTPDELRTLADKMEKQWSSADDGDCMVAYEIDDERINIKFVVDRSKMN